MTSVVFGLLKTVYAHHPPAKGERSGAKSWRRLAAGLRQVLKAAITTSLSFALDDFKDIHEWCEGRYWLSGGQKEGFYRIAVEHDNLSACRSFEHWQGRKPFIWQGKRLACNSKFLWPGKDITETVYVTSIHNTHIVACSYHGPRYSGKTKRRYTITHEQLRAAQRKATTGGRR